MKNAVGNGWRVLSLAGWVLFSADGIEAASADLWQGRNGSKAAPYAAVEWVKGNAGTANAHYVQDHSIPYRLVMADLSTGAHRVVIEWDTRRQGRHAIDFVTSYDRLEPHALFPGHDTAEAVDPLSGLAGEFGPAQTFPIPGPGTVGSPIAGQPAARFHRLPLEERVLTIWNGVITNAVYLSEEDLASSIASTRLAIDFVVTSLPVVLAWGGHIAMEYDWGLGQAATSIQGSPYHMRLLALDSGAGNQDRSVEADTTPVPPPCQIEGPGSTCAGTELGYALAYPSTAPEILYGWRLADNLSGAVIVGSSTGPSIQVAAGPGGSFLVEVTVTLGTNASVCSFPVTVTTPPQLIAPGDRVVSCFGEISPPDPALPTVVGGSGEVTVSYVNDTVVTNGCDFLVIRTYQATDACGLSALAEQRFLVQDRTPPVVVCPADQRVECVSFQGTQVFFEVSASDQSTGPVEVVCQPPSGTFFPRGTNVVRATATDECGNLSRCEFVVVVVDSTAPELGDCPASFVVSEDPPGSGAAVVFYAPPAVSDGCDPGVEVVCVPPPGSRLPVGLHTVVCTATDATGNQDQCAFQVQVVPRVIVADSTADSGPGTLRQALLDANSAPGTNVIVFSIPGEGPFVIRLESPLPVLEESTVVDGTSQPGFAILPVIGVDGAGAGEERIGLRITAGRTRVSGLILSGFTIGILLENEGGNVIQGNLIGLDPEGVLPPGNTTSGIVIRSSGNIVGGLNTGDRNVISGNGAHGILLEGPGARGNVIQGNWIGLGLDGQTPSGNAGDGIFLGDGAGGNLIGGPESGAGNRIAHNAGNGVALSSLAGVGNPILGNSIFANAALGIDLGGDGVTPNDLLDADAGPNGGQNFPVVTAVVSTAADTTVRGQLSASPGRTHVLEVFANDTPDASGFGEGQARVGVAVATTDDQGLAGFEVTLPVPLTLGQVVTATATDGEGNTSEFSGPADVQQPPMILVQPAGTNVVPGTPVMFCVEATGYPALEYQWRQNGANILGETNPCLVIPDVQLADGGDYTVVVANALGVVVSEAAALVVIVPAVQAGDNFADRVLLSGLEGVVAGTNVLATREPGEPVHVGKPGGKSLWYTWQAPETGIATFATTGSTFDTLLAIYSGNLLETLVPVSEDEDRGGFFTSGVRFNTVAGAFYQVAIDGFGGAAGEYVFSWSLEPTSRLLPLILEQPVSQTVAPGASATFMVVAEGGCADGHHDCRHTHKDHHDQHPGDSETTYQWLLGGAIIPGAVSPILTITNVQLEQLGAYSALVTWNGETVESLSAQLQINQTGLSVQRAQAHDKFLDAALGPDPLRLGLPLPVLPGPLEGGGGGSIVRGYTGTQVFNTTGSYTEEGEAPICGVVGGASQWIVFLVGADGELNLTTQGSSFDTVMAVYTRTASGLSQLECNNNAAPNVTYSALTVPVRAGTTNFIVVDGVNRATGILRLNYSLVIGSTLIPVGVDATGAYRFQVIGRPEMNLEIQVSGNLGGWSSLLRTNAPGGFFEFTDPASAGMRNRYYRVLMLP